VNELPGTDMVQGRVLVVGGGQGIGEALAAAWPEQTTVWTRRSGVDATDPNALRTAFAAFQQQHGAPFALLHTIGDFAEQPLLGTDLATWRHLFASNVDSAFHTIQAVVPAMVQARRGRVVLFAAAGVDQAVVQLARSLALETAKAGLTVNVVAPGLIHHPHSHQESQQRLLGRVPAGRLGHVDDVVGMVRYLLSDAASYVTGQVLTVDGGLQA
jgi:3-oxoacyl-[acyl-carrier protein] reductase